MEISRASRSHGDQEGKLEEAAPALQASLELSDADIEKLIAEFASPQGTSAAWFVKTAALLSAGIRCAV